jgi:hypothetical protein
MAFIPTRIALTPALSLMRPQACLALGAGGVLRGGRHPTRDLPEVGVRVLVERDRVALRLDAEGVNVEAGLVGLEAGPVPGAYLIFCASNASKNVFSEQ